ncbi:MAG: type II toxin-antitoxin system RelE/ParE family toxin [Planctomycetes bacterium]|nr:type II toxin-antitoxin system RelE/ParE family toxin [Planctomycetota bacterium]
MRKVTVHDEAVAEMIEAAIFYESRSPGLGELFLDEIERALGQIALHPGSAPRVGKDIRRKMLRRFPYGLLYAVAPGGLSVLAVAHQGRKPGYWRHRR